MSATVEPSWIVMCDECCLCRRLDSAETAAVLVLEHNAVGGCPGALPIIDKKKRIGLRYLNAEASA